MTVLEASRIKKEYQMGEVTVSALGGVNLLIEKGEFVAIMGPSGSGKSTLLHLLGGLDGPTDGEITLAGQPLSRLSDNEITVVRRRKVGFIFQFYNLLPTLTAEENVGLPRLIDGLSLDKHREKIEKLLALVSLADRKHHKPDTLLREADFVSLHVPLYKATYHLIGAAELAKMKPTAILINTARGGVVDMDALYQALKDRVINCAALDVTEPEPIPLEHPLLSLENVIITPHIASASVQTRGKMIEIALDNLLRGVNGDQLRYCVNPQVYELDFDG